MKEEWRQGERQPDIMEEESGETGQRRAAQPRRLGEREVALMLVSTIRVERVKIHAGDHGVIRAITLSPPALAPDQRYRSSLHEDKSHVTESSSSECRRRNRTHQRPRGPASNLEPNSPEEDVGGHERGMKKETGGGEQKGEASDGVNLPVCICHGSIIRRSVRDKLKTNEESAEAVSLPLIPVGNDISYLSLSELSALKFNDHIRAAHAELQQPPHHQGHDVRGLLLRGLLGKKTYLCNVEKEARKWRKNYVY
ncbi:unnamed protein product [Pleuronectes platessa]|uniref:Uncharacterized protein n=1 Tax=Pleuronectes platessa TaxID=8262 RepID=A0A9N7V0U4_PLEPL|nr:unnamed protein product [Pleuronectes platessa]